MNAGILGPNSGLVSVIDISCFSFFKSGDPLLVLRRQRWGATEDIMRRGAQKWTGEHTPLAEVS